MTEWLLLRSMNEGVTWELIQKYKRLPNARRTMYQALSEATRFYNPVEVIKTPYFACMKGMDYHEPHLELYRIEEVPVLG